MEMQQMMEQMTAIWKAYFEERRTERKAYCEHFWPYSEPIEERQRPIQNRWR
jgi:hypothetical protein